MSFLTATTIAALLVASPSATNADRIAANGGFLLGNAQRCGLATDRVERAGHLIRGLIAAATNDSKDEEAATTRFTAFFLVSAVAGEDKEQPLASCRIVSRELARLQRHGLKTAAAGE